MIVMVILRKILSIIKKITIESKDNQLHEDTENTSTVETKTAEINDIITIHKKGLIARSQSVIKSFNRDVDGQ